jgi:error-prone DNA polymerase
MYVELHASSAFSFLDGASLPERLVERAAALGYDTFALVDRDGVYGAPRFYQAAKQLGVRPIVGASVTVGAGWSGESGKAGRKGHSDHAAARRTSARLVSDPPDRPALPAPPALPGLPALSALTVLVASPAGYRNLCSLITRMKLRAPKGEGALALDEFDGHTEGLVTLVGRDMLRACDAAARARDADAPDIERTIDQLIGMFGRRNVYIELQRHLLREQEADNRRLRDLAAAHGVSVVATGGVRFAEPHERPLYDVLTCIRHKTDLEHAGQRLSGNSERYLKSPRQMETLFADIPDAIAASRALADRLAFTLKDLGYRFPVYPVPPGDTLHSYLRLLTDRGARERYRPYEEKAQRQIEYELAMIEKLDLSGYFLIVWDIVQFCRERHILVQGRGSAANSAVCYSLGITAVDAVKYGMLFERFLSEERGEWPDIDLDLPSGDRRESVIQHVYDKYGRLGAAMTANVITYRGRSAAREVGKALGLPADRIDRLAKLMNNFEFKDPGDPLPQRFAEIGWSLDDPRLRLFATLWQQLQDLPRHLGQHSGGMVIAQGHLDTVVPIENASMPDRTVIQWDKDDCADLGIVKVDLLGLGMMAALEDAIVLVDQHVAPGAFDIAHLPDDDPDVYQLLRTADTIGVFQVESRAQMATLPRLAPDHFYDIVVEVAIIRPGPIVGNMVHPYLNRRAGREPVSYAHPSLEPILERTLGVPLFQEQLLRMAMTVAGFTGGQAEELRRAMGFKRSEKRMQKIEVQLRDGMARNGITGKTADDIVTSITSFALYGFPESHAISFALLAYASAYLKVRFPSMFYTALLNNQPMGFYHPATLVKEAQRRGVHFAAIDVQQSAWNCTIEPDGRVRIGLRYVDGLRKGIGEVIECMVPSATAAVEATPARRFHSLDHFVRATGARRDELQTLAEIGALNAFGYTRRAALWQIERAVRPGGQLFIDTDALDDASPLRTMTDGERLHADYHGTGLTIGRHPMAFRRAALDARGAVRARDLLNMSHGHPVRTAGAVITRQRPGTAKGFVFLTMEDETGLINVIVNPQLFAREWLTIIEQPFLLVEGILQNVDGVINIRAERMESLKDMPTDVVMSHDFH